MRSFSLPTRPTHATVKSSTKKVRSDFILACDFTTTVACSFIVLPPSLPPPLPAEPYVLVWSAQDAKEKLENLIVIRTTFLAPFLFGEQTFCEEVRMYGSFVQYAAVLLESGGTEQAR